MEQEREISYQKMKRSPEERHTETYLICFNDHRCLSQSEESKCMWTHGKDGATCVHIIYSLLIEKDICDRRNILNKFPRVCAFPPEMSSFLGKRFPFHFLYFSTLLSTWSLKLYS